MKNLAEQMNTPTGQTFPKLQVWDRHTKIGKKIESLVAEKAKSVLILLPIGLGKPIVTAELIRQVIARDGRVIFFARGRELILQCSDYLDKLGVEHGIIMPGERPRLMRDAQVASIHTFTKWLDRGIIERPKANLLIFDEGHHRTSNTYLKLINHYSHANVIGLTAKPVRDYGRELGLKVAYS